MKSAAIFAVAVALLAVSVFDIMLEVFESPHSPAVAETADTVSYGGNTCMLWNDRYVCTI